MGGDLAGGEGNSTLGTSGGMGFAREIVGGKDDTVGGKGDTVGGKGDAVGGKGDAVGILSDNGLTSDPGV